MMCIPCVMCGACMEESQGGTAFDGTCPACGESVDADMISCPICFTLLPKRHDGNIPRGEDDVANAVNHQERLRVN